MKIQVWTRGIEVTLAIRSRMDGGVPQNPELIAGWMKTNNKELTEDERKLLVEATKDQLGDIVNEQSKAMWTTFKQDKQGRIYYEGRCAKAAFKEASNVLRDMLVKADKKANDDTKSRFTNLKSKVAERLFVEEDQIYFLVEKDGQWTTIDRKALKSEERPIHVMTAQGPRTALKKVDYVEAPVRIKFTCRVLNDGLVDRDLVETFFEYMGENGLGANRSQGMGKFDLVELKWPETTVEQDIPAPVKVPAKKAAVK